MRPFCLIILLSLFCAGARAQGTPPATLRVATGQAAPFVLSQPNIPTTGFAIELWAALAQRLGVTYRLIDLGPRSDAAQLQAVQTGTADVAISAIVMTPAREEAVDFSLPYFESGLQIMVGATAAESPVLVAIEALFSPAIGQLLLVGLGIVFLLANLLWVIERRANPAFRQGYLRGVSEGLWGVVLIIATGEHGDRDAPGGVKRLTVALMWLFGVVLIAQFTATVTSSLTVQQLQSSIRGPADLPGRRIATVPGSIAADYLTQLGLPFVAITSTDQAAELLARGQVQAIVYDAPALQYWAARRGNGAFQVVGPLFRPEKLGIAVATGSPLRKDINRVLLEMFADGSYEDIRHRWFTEAGR